MFLALEKLGVALEFINLVRLLFKNAEAAVCLNGSITRSFRIKRGVRQGCPLPTTSYLLWSQDLPPNFKLRWKDIWIKCKARKESSFLWSPGIGGEFLENENRPEFSGGLPIL